MGGERSSRIWHTEQGMEQSTSLASMLRRGITEPPKKNTARKEAGKLGNGKAIEKLLAFLMSTHHTHHIPKKRTGDRGLKEVG